VEIFYLVKATAWQDKGHERMTLPALDLPISRTGMLLYYPPAFKLNAEPGSFHTQEYQSPSSAVLLSAIEGGRDGGGVFAVAGRRGAALAPLHEEDRLEEFGKAQRMDDKEKKDSTLALLDDFRAKSTGGKVTGILPVNVSFPAFGPSMFLVSELTSENQFPAAEFSFQRDKKGGVR